MQKKEKKKIKIDRRVIIKKLILAVLLLAALIFLFAERDCLRTRHKASFYNKTIITRVESISVKGYHTIRQPFVAETGGVGNFFIRFVNPDASSATGKIAVMLEDSSGKVVTSTVLDASQLNVNEPTQFVLGKDSEVANQNRIVSTVDRTYLNNYYPLDKGEMYTLVINCVNVDGNGPIELAILTDATQLTPEGTLDVDVDGEKIPGGRLRVYTHFLSYAPDTIITIVLLTLLCLIFILCPFEYIEERYPDRKISLYITRAMFVLSPFIAYFVMERYAGYRMVRFLGQLFSFAGLLNLIILGLIWWLIFTVTNSTRVTSFVTVLAFSLFGLVCYALLLFRDTPLIATDLAQIGTAMQVANTYTLTYNKSSLLAIFYNVLWCIASIAPPGHKGLELRQRAAAVTVLAVWCGVFYYTFFSSTVIKDHEFRVSGFKPRDSYFENGNALSFVITMKNSVVEKPEGYSPETVEQLADKYPSDTTLKSTKVSSKTPDIIVIMNESFADLADLGEISSNEDWMPYYRSIKENAIKGRMTSSVFGGSTANSEFEFLTGFSMRFLPYMSVPYRSSIKAPIPALPRYLSELGYFGNIAFHPGMRNSYNRNNVYPLLGFERHIAIDEIEEPENIRDYMSDECDYGVIIKEYEDYTAKSDAPFFLFNVTIQNHGGYSYKKGVVDAGISIEDTTLQEETAEQFINLIKYSDEALKGLIEYFSQSDRETVIVFFGDHQPRVDEDWLELMRERQGEITDLEWTDKEHQVPFMIWANFDIDEATGVRMSANYMSSFFRSLIGMPLTGYDKYMTDMYSKLPVITAVEYKDQDGKIYDPDEPSKFSVKLNEYATVQYNGMIDVKNRVDRFFELSEKKDAKKEKDEEDSSDAKESSSSANSREELNSTLEAEQNPYIKYRTDEETPSLYEFEDQQRDEKLNAAESGKE